jgi:hypothetical protein
MEESVFSFGDGCRLLNTDPSLQVIHSLWAVCAIDRESLVGSLMTGEKWTCYLVRGEGPLVPTVISALFKRRDILTGGFLQRSESSRQNAVSHTEAELCKATIGFVMSGFVMCVCPSVSPHGTTRLPVEGFS